MVTRSQLAVPFLAISLLIVGCSAFLPPSPPPATGLQPASTPTNTSSSQTDSSSTTNTGSNNTGSGNGTTSGGTGNVSSSGSGNVTTGGSGNNVVNGNGNTTVNGGVSNTVINTQPKSNGNPTITSVGAASSLTASVVGNITAVASDPDGDTLSYSWSAPSGGTISGSGATVSFISPKAGSFPVSVTVNDGKGGTAQSNVTISVAAPPPISDVLAADKVAINPSGNWSFGTASATGANFVPFPTRHALGTTSGSDTLYNWITPVVDAAPYFRANPFSSSRTISGWGVVIPAGTMYMRPFTGMYGVVRWTAPRAGDFVVSGSVAGLLASSNISSTAVLRTVTSQYWRKDVNSTTPTNFSEKISLDQGESVFLVVDGGGNGGDDETVISIQVDG